MKHTILFFGLSLLVIAKGLAQSDFRPGYMVLQTKDTVHGELDFRNDYLMSTKCKFRKAEGAAEVEYLPGDIQTFRFLDSRCYVSRKIESGSQVFLQYLINGLIDIYYLKDDKGNRYFIEKAGQPLTELGFKKTIEYEKTGKYFERQSTTHIGILKYFSQDAPNLTSTIDKIQKPQHDNLINFAKVYHQQVCDGESCIVFEQPQPFLKLNAGFVYGLANYQNLEGLNDKGYSQYGIILNMWMPRSNERLYLRTGVLHAKVGFEDRLTSVYKIPLHIQYLFPGESVRPSFSYGLNFYNTVERSVSLNAGLNFNMGGKVYLKTSSELEFFSTALVLPNEYLSFSLNAGLFVRL